MKATEKPHKTAQFGKKGKKEAWRRRVKGMEINEGLNDLTTSDIEFGREKNRASDPVLTIQAKLRVNGKSVWASSLGTKNQSVFSIWEFEQALKSEIAKRDGHTKNWTTNSITVTVRVNHSRARKRSSVHLTIIQSLNGTKFLLSLTVRFIDGNPNSPPKQRFLIEEFQTNFRNLIRFNRPTRIHHW